MSEEEPPAVVRPVEAGKVTVVCPECADIVRVNDIHAFLLGLHQRACGELLGVNGE